MMGRRYWGWVAVIGLMVAGCGDDDRPTPGERDAGYRRDAGPPPRRDAGMDAGPSADDPLTLARAAVVMSSCLGGSSGALLFAAYNSQAQGEALSTLLREHAVCLASAGGGCDALDACLGIELDVAGDCTPGCDGDAAVFCDGGHVRWRCADVGLTCEDGGCVASLGPCTESGCMDGRPVRCVDAGVPDAGVPDAGLAARTVAVPGPDCAAHGTVCEERTPGEPACYGTGDACEPLSVSSVQIRWVQEAIECASSEQLVSCISGAQHQVGCADLMAGMRCRTTSEVEMRPYCGLGSECNPFTTVVEYCSDRSVVVCNAGRLENISCESLGFSRCATGHCL